MWKLIDGNELRSKRNGSRLAEVLSRKRLIRFERLPVTVRLAGSLLFRSLVKACRVRHEYVALPSSGLAALIWRSPCDVTTNLPPANKVESRTQADSTQELFCARARAFFSRRATKIFLRVCYRVFCYRDSTDIHRLFNAYFWVDKYFLEFWVSGLSCVISRKVRDFCDEICTRIQRGLKLRNILGCSCEYVAPE